MEPEFPLEFLVSGTPVSQQASSPSKDAWKATIRAAGRDALPEGYWVTYDPVAIKLFYFPAEPMAGDIDNILKPILDALTACIYSDDHQVERLLVQRFDPDSVFDFPDPSPTLTEAIAGAKPKLYIRISTDPFEELR